MAEFKARLGLDAVHGVKCSGRARGLSRFVRVPPSSRCKSGNVLFGESVACA